MALMYIDCVDDENYLTAIMLEKDFYGRDVLKIAVELELNVLVQNSKVEAIIQRLWNSDYDTSGSLF